MDRRWQLALDCLDCTDAPFSVGTLVPFRERLIATDLDRRLVERTVEVAARTKGFGHTALRAALDSSPLWGAGRVEDTYNLLGHALRKAVGVRARQQGRELADVAAAGAPVLAGTGLKAALDLDWDDPAARTEALGIVLAALGAIEAEVATQPEGRARTEARERVQVEHSLAHIGAWQGDRARYLGQRKNLLDTRRMAAVENLHIAQRLPAVVAVPRAA